MQKGAWQFPQGGIDPGETALEAVRREIGEEVGFLPSQYDIVESGFWYSRRRSQSLSWVQSLVHEALLTAFEQHPAVASRMQSWFHAFSGLRLPKSRRRGKGG